MVSGGFVVGFGGFLLGLVGETRGSKVVNDVLFRWTMNCFVSFNPNEILLL